MSKATKRVLNIIAPLFVLLIILWSFASFSWLLWKLVEEGKSQQSPSLPSSVTFTTTQAIGIYLGFLVLFGLFLSSFAVITSSCPGIASNTYGASAGLTLLDEQEADEGDNNISMAAIDSQLFRRASLQQQHQEDLVPLGLGSERVRVIEVKPDGAERYCVQCELKKPSRTHHCSICEACVLKMDHHCPWIGNCVGHYNQKLFILFLLYGLLYCFYVFILVSPVTIQFAYNFTLQRNETLYFNTLILPLVAAVFGLCFFLFLGMHIYYVCTNQTTLQQLGDCTTVRVFKDGSTDSRHHATTKLNIYDVGLKINFFQVFGSNPWVWLLPIQSAQLDGYEYPTNEKTLASIFNENFV